MAAGGWNSGHASLKSFTYPVPETRFFHVGRNVYKFKIKYGHTISINVDLPESIVSEELEEAIRVILGNLDNLRPFTTEHLVIFPYLNKWEKVSDLRLKQGDVFLIPYPYVCTIYIELNSWQQSVIWGKAGYRDASNSVNSRYKLKEKMDTGGAAKWRRRENKAKISHIPLYVDRNVAKNATCIFNTTEPDVGFGRGQLQKGIYPTQSQPEEIQHKCHGTTIANSGYDDVSLWEHRQTVRTENEDNRKQEGQVPVLPGREEENVELKNRGFFELLKSTVFTSLVQRIFSGSHQSP